jgi:4-hydroxy 2-oxovalerate aldolase
MQKLKVLDCTLRDGGYINNWNFGSKSISKVISLLEQSRIDIIEIGFLSNQVFNSIDSTRFNSLKYIDSIISKKINTMHVCMINYGEFDQVDIDDAKNTNIDGIRVAFHKKDMKDAMNFCLQIIKKGFKVFVQPMVTNSYSDEEFLELIKMTNEINPYAFYIVDSFGVMNQYDVLKFFQIADYNLNSNIYLGFHSHNNLQLSFSHSQKILSLKSNRNLIIDSSIYGMGRGAGNLNTELIIGYLNQSLFGNYKIEPILEAIDYEIKPIYSKKQWGYSLPYYLSAYHNCHPNYATYLEDLSTITVQDISEILSRIEPSKKVIFEKKYIDNLYKKHQEKNQSKSFLNDDLSKLSSFLREKSVVLIAPGKTSEVENLAIKKFIQTHDVKVIAINYEPENINVDFIFYSNKRRFDKKKPTNNVKIILTSNIEDHTENYYHINYEDLINEIPFVEDNAGLMAIQLLSEFSVRNIYLAGFDGYNIQSNIEESFAKKDLATNQSLERLENINMGMNIAIKDYSKTLSISFVTSQINIKL